MQLQVLPLWSCEIEDLVCILLGCSMCMSSDVYILVLQLISNDWHLKQEYQKPSNYRITVES